MTPQSQSFAVIILLARRLMVLKVTGSLSADSVARQRGAAMTAMGTFDRAGAAKPALNSSFRGSWMFLR
jgi:hypothetical protein